MSLDEKLKTSLDGMLELRHQMEKMDQIPSVDRDKIQDDYHHYERIVRHARHDIQRHLNFIRQKEADQTGGALAKVPGTVNEPKREEPPRRKEHDRYFSDDLSKKDKQMDWIKERRLQAEMYREFEIKKLLADQKKDFENRLQQAFAKKDLEQEAQRKASKGVKFQTPNPFPDNIPQFSSTPNNRGPETQRR